MYGVALGGGEAYSIYSNSLMS